VVEGHRHRAQPGRRRNCNNCGNGIPSVQNVYDWQADRGISAYNHPFVDSTSVVWTLPIGPGHRLGGNMNRAWNTALGAGRQQISFRLAAATAHHGYSPNNNTQVSSLITISGRNSYRPNLTGSPIMSTDRSYNPTFSGIQYLNGAAYSTPPAMRPLAIRPATPVRGFAYYQLDTA